MADEVRQSLLGRVLDWLRAGYPDGVPPKDYPPLLAVLSRRLTGEEVDRIAADLASSGGGPDAVTESDIRRLVEARLFDAASDEDIARVSGRLAVGGWPLGEIDHQGAGDHAQSNGSTTDDDLLSSTSATRAPLLGRVVAWLREGYPEGVPEQDYIPLLALLRRRLTDDEVKAVAKGLRKGEVSPVGRADIAVEITKITNAMPSEQDLERVRARLAKKGWPLDFAAPDYPV